jgi:hypothetical protein
MFMYDVSYIALPKSSDDPLIASNISIISLVVRTVYWPISVIEYWMF